MKLKQFIESLDKQAIPAERKAILQPLIDYINGKYEQAERVRLNFICTHNSRRSHLSQIWAQVMANYFEIDNVYCYSGGTEATAMYHMVAETLENTGAEIVKICGGENPVYAIECLDVDQPIIAFSKVYNHAYNPRKSFAAVMTCDHADENCPFISGAEVRIPVTYEDPKAFDHTPQQAEKYAERSMQIATEMKYVFSKINS